MLASFRTQAQLNRRQRVNSGVQERLLQLRVLGFGLLQEILKRATNLTENLLRAFSRQATVRLHH
jgi:hypothetical protein